MSLSQMRVLPRLSGQMVTAGPWNSTFCRPGLRMYPYHMGTYVNGDVSTVTVPVHGRGNFRANDYVMPCTRTAYGNSFMYVPRTTSISKVSSVSGSDDQLTLTSALTLFDKDYLLNLGTDGATTPTIAPNYDGSRLELYADPVGNALLGSDYVLTGSQGQFECYLNRCARHCDVLITDGSGSPELVIPGVLLVPESPLGYRATASVSIATASETSMFAAGFGQRAILGNFAEVGFTVRLRVEGSVQGDSSKTATIKIKWGSTVLLSQATPAPPVGPGGFVINVLLVVNTTGATGTVTPSGHMLVEQTTGAGTLLPLNATAQTVDLTATAAPDITATWSGSGVSFTVLNSLQEEFP